MSTPAKHLFQKYTENKPLPNHELSIDKLKVLETFKRSVDYFNSYGLPPGKRQPLDPRENGEEDYALKDKN